MKKSDNISSMDRKRRLLLKKNMSKKAYSEFCKRYRCKMTMGRNYVTRIMQSARDKERYGYKRKNSED